MEKKDLNILFSTLGGSLGSVTSILRFLRWDILYIFVSDKFHKGAHDIKDSILLLHPKSKEKIKIIVIDAFDIEDCISKIVVAHKELRKAWSQTHKLEFSFNMTGGTNIMSSSMLLSGYILSTNVFYVKANLEDENDDGELIKMPLPKLELNQITDKMKEIMFQLSNGRRLKLVQLANIAEFKSTPALKRHTDKLIEKNILETTKVGRDVFVSLTISGRILYSLLIEN